MSEVTLAIEALGARGDGIALHEGRRLHVPFALPGETIRARLSGEGAELVTILTANPDRFAAECVYFTACGGCVLQHLSPPRVADWKRERVASALGRVGLSPPIASTRDAHGAGRRRITLHIRQREGAIVAGFMRAKSHQVIDLEACPLLVPALAGAPDIARRIGHILRGVPKPLDLQFTATAIGLDLDLRGAGTLDNPLRQKLISYAVEAKLARLTLHGERLIEVAPPFVELENTNHIKAFLPPGAFLQATARAEALLAEIAGDKLAGAKHIADLFCGLGPFGLRLGNRMKVSGYDSDKGAIEAFRRSIRADPGGKPVVAEARDLFRRPLFASELKAFDAVLLDPPRQGAQAQVTEIAKSKLTRVVYISCDPESFARDAATLVKAGFRLGEVIPVDQFRHSPHVELVADFSR
jgi:23S rRNA (uracil1939-C5)-methyltransferase